MNARMPVSSIAEAISSSYPTLPMSMIVVVPERSSSAMPESEEARIDEALWAASRG